MFGIGKKKEKTSPETKAENKETSTAVKYKNMLTLTLRAEGYKESYHVWHVVPNKELGLKTPWKHFLTWYHCRKQSEDYVFTVNNGDAVTSIRRKDIVKYEINFFEIKE